MLWIIGWKNQKRRWGWFEISMGSFQNTTYTVLKVGDQQCIFSMNDMFFSFLLFQTNVGTISESLTQITSLHPVIRCLTTRLRNAYGWLQLQDRTRGFWSTSTHTLTWKTESASKCSVFGVEVRHLLVLFEHVQDWCGAEGHTRAWLLLVMISQRFSKNFFFFFL